MASKLEKSRMNFNGKNCFLIILGHGLALFIAISHGFTFGFDSGRLHQAPPGSCAGWWGLFQHPFQ